MRPKGAKGAAYQPPIPGGPTCPSFGLKTQPTQKWPKPPQDPKLAKNHEMASGNHQRPPSQLQARIPLKFKGRLFLPQCTSYSRIQEWCTYGIIYHHAPFLLRNPKVTF
ncbi:hypothetical protein O181_040370 [Austropuccinia psidii MF-1]|uniref:Uncharacterized protein n=1 Tax=Austropuccinia psidii MF-1 TaxID=1389203 RepID=A0A9Q3DD24_9BASI|nr:hypothetical protein [Austropuccinia psidii MF-1]